MQCQLASGKQGMNMAALILIYWQCHATSLIIRDAARRYFQICRTLAAVAGRRLRPPWPGRLLTMMKPADVNDSIFHCDNCNFNHRFKTRPPARMKYLR